MKILITGANGLIGSFLAKKYAELGHEVIGIDDFSNSDPELVSAEADGYKLFEADAGDLDAMNRYCNGVDAIFHTACLPFEGFSNVSPCEVSTSVFNPTVSVGTAAVNNGVKKIFNFSSMARYGKNPELPFREEMIPTPSDPYGVAKVASENMLNVMSDIYNIFKVVHIVPHNVFGKKSVWNDPRRGVLNIFINQILLEQPLTIHNSGEQKRSFSFVEDVFSFAEDLLNWDFKNKEILNVGPDTVETYLSINELADIVLAEIKHNPKKVFRNYIKKVNDVEEAWCSSDKVRKLFNWETKSDIKVEIKKIISHIKENGAAPFKYNFNIEINTVCPQSWLIKE